MNMRMRGKNLMTAIFAITAIVIAAFADDLPDAAEFTDDDFGALGLTDTSGIADFMDLVDLIDTFGDMGIADFMDNVDLIIGDTGVVDTTGQTLSSSQRRDTIDTLPDLAGTILGFEAALSIGAVPLFELWENSLPSTLSDLELTSTFGIDTDLFPGDNAFLRYRITESPSQFNFVVPFGMSLRRTGSSGNSLSLGLSLFQANKRFQSEIYMDGTEAPDRRIDLYESLVYSSVSLEAAYRRVIPSTYFSIDGSRQTYFTFAAGISPLNVFTRYRELKNHAHDEDGRMKIIEAAVDSVLGELPPITANGTSLTWRVGVSTLRNNTMEMGLYYGGSYSFNFHSDGEPVAQNQICGSDSEQSGNPLSFMTSRIEFRITFLMPVGRTAGSINHDDNGGDE